jgi:hypothetical protein
MATKHIKDLTIATHRTLTEARLQHLLDNIDNAASVEMLKTMVYEFDRTDDHPAEKHLNRLRHVESQSVKDFFCGVLHPWRDARLDYRAAYHPAHI